MAAIANHDYTQGVCLCPGCEMARGFDKAPLLKFAVRVDADGDRHFYTGLFPSSWGAVEDALERFGEDVTRIHVRKVTA